MISEIGSEFQEYSAKLLDEQKSMVPDDENIRYVQSGRTGLALIADELQRRNSVKTIALPSYCCSSMVCPFYKEGFEVLFYPIPSDLKTDVYQTVEKAAAVIQKADAVVVMDYFGFVRDFAYHVALTASALNKTLIVDATQTAFSQTRTFALADYILTSYRKWSDILCALVYAKEGFASEPYTHCHEDYNTMWRTAAASKKKYLDGEHCEKALFLSVYKEANCILADDYEKYAAKTDEVIKQKRIDAEALVCQRRSNAQYLIDALVKYDGAFGLHLLFDTVYPEDCPLFVPIVVEEGKREIIRRKLADKQVYCPAHWPIDKAYPYEQTALHRSEISLICDQRYGIDAMQKEATDLIEILKTV